MNAPEYYKRVSGCLDFERLQMCRVAVIGLGSGGGRVAAELGRLGIALLLLERPRERLLEHNIVRHVLGYDSLNKPKLRQMAQYIANLNPGTRLTLCALDVVKNGARFETEITAFKPNLLAVCTDNEQSKHAINRVALRLGIPQVGAGVYDGGIGGEVYRVRPGEACYGCVSERLQLLPYTPEPPGNFDYDDPHNDDVRSTCALNLDIEQIALLQCRLILDTLLGQNLSGVPREVNLCVFANRKVPGTFARPLHCEFFALLRQAACLECGQPPSGYESKAAHLIRELRAGAAAPGHSMPGVWQRPGIKARKSHGPKPKFESASKASSNGLAP